MSYLGLARKWRPHVFEDLVGQEPIVRVLGNAIEQGKLGHAYVFSGPRGVGKTSTARILAMSLNCTDGPTPCGKCDSCRSIADSSSVDVIEIDGASNNSVDDIRDLRERVKYAPSSGEYKVYIIDEAHMLSTSAFNALLKTLEEPPPHVIFVLATTEAKKIPLTVLSRCQHLPFRRVSMSAIKARLTHITESEGMKATDGALSLIARAADGSIRDSLTILDQVASFSEDIHAQDILDMLDITDIDTLGIVAAAVLNGQRDQIMLAVAELVDLGADLRTFTKDLIGYFRNLLVVSLVPSGDDILDVAEDELAHLKKLASQVTEEHLTLILSELVKMENDVRTAFSPRVSLEMSLLKISYLSTFRSVDKAIKAITSAGPSSEYDIPFEKSVAAPVDAHIASDEEMEADDTSVPEASEPATKEPPVEGGNENEPEPASDAPIEAPEPARKTSFTGPALLHAVQDRLMSEDPLLGSKISKAKATYRDGVFALTFKDNPGTVEAIAEELCVCPVKLEIHIKASPPSEGRKDIKEKAMSDPLIKEAMDLFDSRIVDIKKTEDK